MKPRLSENIVAGWSKSFQLRAAREIDPSACSGRARQRRTYAVMAGLYKSEILEDWRLASERKPMNKIPPLE